ncbi:MAG: MaoC family dehydratase [Ignavibacteriae bacterium]|jgi:acyl dehydratase|nr:MaoC family dehydratase [Ignavibacteriota bacterium]NOG99597.1 MaoC family dehydratase [Ignavibacteriota bacterium]
MSTHIVASFEELEKIVGIELGPTEYIDVDQERINKFAEATGDYQWIHVDVERAKVESPFKKTIAHGYLTVSLIPAMIDKVLEFQNTEMTVNYEIEKMRFMQPVLVGSRVRMHAKIVDVKLLRGISKVTSEISFEIEGEKKPACKGNIIILYYFKQD